tara:strand:- start:344 stop:832 length:489 start_codon:yes stop_codon:yes gene_type:complete
MNISSSIHQIYLYIIVSTIFSISLNVFRSDPLSLIAQDLVMVESVEELSNDVNQGIKEISLEIARDLFEKNILFIDARAEEYYLEGHIPGAICNDNFDQLINDIDSRIINNDFFVVYCSDDDCGSSEELAYQLFDQGYLNIYLFKGGWKQWIENSLPSSKHL